MTYTIIFLMVMMFILAFIFPSLYILVKSCLYLLLLLTAVDMFLLFRHAAPMSMERRAKYNRLSNGDENEIYLTITNHLNFSIRAKIIDELPMQFQIRNFLMPITLSPGEERTLSYSVRPVDRGEFWFGKINAIFRSPLGLVSRHYKSGDNFMMASYPSFVRLRQFELMAISNRLSELGIKKIRKIGHSTEFEQIKEYAMGDDVRTINWKATARRAQLMVNHYRDERAQQVYSVIDTGRIMKMPFNGMTLLNYSVNASLVIGHVAWVKQDKPGLITFSNKPDRFVPADRKGNQLLRLQEALYNTNTDYQETNYEYLLTEIRQKVRQRSLLLIFSNFETLSGLQRQIKYIRKLAASHLVVMVLFENTELRNLLRERPQDTFKIYEQTIAQKFEYEKRQIIRELQQYGVLTVYTAPENLTINALNKYLEIKTRGML